ncbi:hypothetical protein LNP24_07285 [Klebsiella pneumoniae subsp. pneumoniae]|nr:hypothetical protein [Klebsiella pneumoniae subsp. pneumoniae]
MGNGTRILLNADGIITDWAKQHFEPVSSPLSAIANPKVAFDLLTPVDNSRHGFSVQQGVQKLKQYGLEFPGTAGSQTTFKEPGLTGLSFLTAFRLSAVDVFQYVLDCRGFDARIRSWICHYIQPDRAEAGAASRDGLTEVREFIISQGMSIIVNKWYVACGVISPNRNHKLTLSDGTAIAASPAGYLANVAGSPLMLGASAAGSSMLKGDMGFFGAWGNEFTAGDIATAIALGTSIMTSRGQTV